MNGCKDSWQQQGDTGEPFLTAGQQMEKLNMEAREPSLADLITLTQDTIRDLTFQSVNALGNDPSELNRLLNFQREHLRILLLMQAHYATNPGTLAPQGKSP